MRKIEVIKYNLELNREWLYLTDEAKKEGEPSHERNFVVSIDYLTKIFDELFAADYPDLDDFLETYTPEEDGELIYQRALKDGEMKNEDICEVDEFLAINEVSEITALDPSDFNTCQANVNDIWVRFSEIEEMIKRGALVVEPDKVNQYHKESRAHKCQ